MKKNLLDFSRLHHFVAFEEGAHAEDNQLPNALGYTTGSYFSALMAECQNPSLVLRSLKSLDKTISKLAQVVREELAAAKKELLPDIYRQGLYSLPFDVLERIFGLFSEDGSVGFYSFMLVSRFFRDTVRKISCLWTNVVDIEDPWVCLKRSRSRGLSIAMTRLSATGPEFDRCLDAVAPQWERWRGLSIKAYWDLDYDDGENPNVVRLQRLREEFSGRIFPALETLEICHQRVWVAGAVNADILSFFSSWNMPALRSFLAFGFVPNLPPACSLSITRFQLELVTPSDVDAVGDVLRGLRYLEEFSLEVHISSSFQGREVKPVALPSLRVFKISTMESNYELIAPLISALDVPNLREVDLKIQAYEKDAVPDLLGLFKRRPIWAQLETLHYSLEMHFDPRIGYRRDAIFPRLPSRLQHLTLEGWDLPPPLRSFWRVNDGLAPLRSLRFRNCNRIDTACILELGAVVFSPSFKTLEIINCPNISADVLRTAMPKGMKLNYEEHNWDVELESFRNCSRRGRYDRGTDDVWNVALSCDETST